MVATDIASRGIDVAGVSHVINYDVPENPEDYVHRIGRTGRAQAVGDAFTLVTPENAGDIRDIQRFIGAKIPELRLEGFPYQPFGVAQPPQPRGQQRPQGQRGHGHGGQNRSRSGGGFRGSPGQNRDNQGGKVGYSFRGRRG
jgi:ATP-dependent RNA helicase RhlE